MLELETSADRAGLFYDGADIALVASIPDARDESGAVVVQVARNVTCRFSREYQSFEATEGFSPTLLLMDDDTQYLPQDHRLMVAGQVWAAEERMPDGTGLTNVRLRLLGRYRLDSADPNVVAGLPFRYGTRYADARYGGRVLDRSIFAPDDAPEALQLAYPYTVRTWLDYDIASNTDLEAA